MGLFLRQFSSMESVSLWRCVPVIFSDTVHKTVSYIQWTMVLCNFSIIHNWRFNSQALIRELFIIFMLEPVIGNRLLAVCLIDDIVNDWLWHSCFYFNFIYFQISVATVQVMYTVHPEERILYYTFPR